MVKHIQTIRRQKPTNCLSVFDHFVGLALKGLSVITFINVQLWQLGPETRLKLSPKMGVLKVKKWCHPAKKIDKLLASNNW